jgi:multiple sugar transport system permease protein
VGLSRLNKKSVTWYKVKDLLETYSFLVPFMAFIVTFSFIPIVQVFYYSLCSGNIMSGMKFSGLNNFIRILTTPDYGIYFINSLSIAAFTIPLGWFLSFMIANFLKRKMRFASAFFEIILFLPSLVSMVGAAVVIMYIFSPEGSVNFVIRSLGFPAVNWLGTTAGARAMIVFLEIWKGIALHIFIYITALWGIPEDYYEVAQIEGAKPFHIMTKITIPLVRRTIFFTTIMSFIWQVQIFDSVYVTTKGGPFDTTKTITYSIYQTTFLNSRPGLGSAISVCFLFIILLVTAVQNYFSNKLEILEY